VKIDVTVAVTPTTLTVEIIEIDGNDDDICAQVCTLVRQELQHWRYGTFMTDAMQGLNLTLGQLQTQDRRSHVTAARQELMVRLDELGWSHTRIGDLLCRDRTTVIHGVSRGYARRQAAG